MKELPKCDTKQDAMRRLSDLVALKNYADHEIARLIGMEARFEYITAFICSSVLNIHFEETASCPFVSGTFTDGPLKDASVRLVRFPDDSFPPSGNICRETDYLLVITGRDAGGYDSLGSASFWTIRSIYLMSSRDLMPSFAENRKEGNESLSEPFPDNSQIYPASKSGLLELTHRQRQLLDLFL